MNIMSLFSAFVNGPAPSLAHTAVDGFAVSTVDTPDMGLETAIIDSEGNAHPVERYPDETLALAGHQRWVDALAAGQRTITKLGYGDLVADTTIELR